MLGVYVGQNRKILQTQNWSTEIDTLERKCVHGKPVIYHSTVKLLLITIGITILVHFESHTYLSQCRLKKYYNSCRIKSRQRYTVIANTVNGGMKLPAI